MDKKISIKDILEMKSSNTPIAVLTAYDFTTAKIIDDMGIDILLVGDSLSSTFTGDKNTLGVTIEQMIYHAKCVVSAVKRSFVVVDMPFGTYQTSPEESVRNAISIIKQTGANAVKLEGGENVKQSIKKIIDAGIPVMGHLGLEPQSINKLGSYSVRGVDEQEAKQILQDAKSLRDIGCFSIVLEKIKYNLAEKISKSIDIPTIGIGAGDKVDGQVLVTSDILGFNKDFFPKFLRKYADMHSQISKAVSDYISDVKSRDFPNENERY